MYIKKSKYLIITLTMIILFSFNRVNALEVIPDQFVGYDYNNISNKGTVELYNKNNRQWYIPNIKNSNYVYVRIDYSQVPVKINGKGNIKFSLKSFKPILQVNFNYTATEGIPCEIQRGNEEQNNFTTVICKNVPLKSNMSYYIKINLNNESGSSYSSTSTVWISKDIQFEKSELGTIEDLNDKDISEESKQEIDDTKLNDYEGKEQELNDIVKNTDFSNVGINLDLNTNNFIWNIIERIKNSSIEFSVFIINILSLGVIKLIFAR